MRSDLLLVASLVGPSVATYVLQDDYQPDNFFDGFEFHDGADANGGFVHYLDRPTAEQQQLASSDNGSIFMGVDSSGVAGDQGRASIRIESKKTYEGGLIMLDAAHMPGGVCGTWPAFWSVGPNWPEDGEVDIIEGINSQTANILAVHTMEGCTVEKTPDLSAELLTTNCFINAPGQDSNQGCFYQDTDPNSYGTGFNKVGGGIYAMEWTADAISVWFFQRDRIPPDANSDNPDPSSWPKPHARFSGSCDFMKYLKDQRFIINTALCGDWPESQWAADPVCSAKAPTCKDYVRNNPDAFKDAYWEINYMKVFQQGEAEPPASSAPAPAPTTAAPTSAPEPEVPAPTPTPTSAPAPSPPADQPAPGDDNNDGGNASQEPGPAPSSNPPNDGSQHECPKPKPKPSCSTYVTLITETIVRSATPVPTNGGDSDYTQIENVDEGPEAIIPIPTGAKRHVKERRWHH